MTATEPAPQAAPSHRVASWTGVRAFAALLVVATHVAFWTGNYGDDASGLLFARLEVGVTIFFVLSGFLLTRPWVTAISRGTDSPSTARYFAHRLRRVLPAYWITVVAAYGIYTLRDVEPAGRSVEGFVRTTTFTQLYEFGHFHQGLTQMWSLAVEVVFYLVLPAVVWLVFSLVCRQRWRPGLATAALSVLTLVSPLWVVFTHDASTFGGPLDPTARMWFPAFAAWFLAGVALAVAAEHVRREPGVRAPNPYLLLGGGLVAFVLACTPAAGEATIVPSDAGAAITKTFLYGASATALIAALVVGERPSIVARVLGSRPAVWLGAISYEIFLVHLVVLELAMSVLGYHVFGGNPLVLFTVTVAASIPIAWLLHRVTRPLLPGAADERRRRARDGEFLVGGDHEERGRAAVGTDVPLAAPRGVPVRVDDDAERLESLQDRGAQRGDVLPDARRERDRVDSPE